MSGENPGVEDVARSGSRTTPMGTGREFVLSRNIAAKRSRVFDAWTDPALMKDWFGPKNFTAPVCELDVRVGGAFRITMRSPDGVDYPLKGVIREIVPGRRLVYTEDVSEHPAEWFDSLNEARRKYGLANPDGEPESIVTVTFDDAAGGSTRMTVRTVFATAIDRNAMVSMGMREGWSQSFDRLDALLAER